ncbi:MAG: hypothetical protein IJ155_11920, partial [Prevotella sp.]|nr:hypothetical protein [Prevotella sp.]
RFLYYYFSVLCKTLKELFLADSRRVSPKADAKVHTFPETPKLFERKIINLTIILILRHSRHAFIL